MYNGVNINMETAIMKYNKNTKEINTKIDGDKITQVKNICNYRI